MDDGMSFAMKMILPKMISFIKDEIKKGNIKIVTSEDSLDYNITISISKAKGILPEGAFEEVKKQLDLK